MRAHVSSHIALTGTKIHCKCIRAMFIQEKATMMLAHRGQEHLNRPKQPHRNSFPNAFLISRSFMQQSQPNDFRDSEVSYSLVQTILSGVQRQSRPYSKSRKQLSLQSHDLWILFHRAPFQYRAKVSWLETGQHSCSVDASSLSLSEFHGEWSTQSAKQQPQRQLHITTRVDWRKRDALLKQMDHTCNTQASSNYKWERLITESFFFFQSVSFTRPQNSTNMSSCSTQDPRTILELEPNAKLLVGEPLTQMF